jgi:hypothetical protein
VGVMGVDGVLGYPLETEPAAAEAVAAPDGDRPDQVVLVGTPT